MILARELRGHDVTANAVAPGPTATDLFLDANSEESQWAQADAVPLQRLADTAEVVAFLAGPAGHWINGQVLRVNGGLV